MQISQIQRHNPWWQRPEHILDNPAIKELEKRKFIYYHPLYDNFPLKKDAILTLRGPRRIGKTTLLMLLIRKLLLEEKINPENICFYPADLVKDFGELHELLVAYLDFIRPKNKNRLFIFLDEISFVADWPRAIKSLADNSQLKNVTVLITGSNILDLKFSSERMPGRRGEVYPWDIEFLPLSFSEYLSLVKPDIQTDSYFKALGFLAEYKKFFTDYLLTGGFPVTINQYYQQGYIDSAVYEIFLNWIEGDLHKTGKSEEVAYRLLERLFVHLTTPVSYYKLSKESGLASHATVAEYLEILEKMFIVFGLPFFSLDERKTEHRKNRKFYFADPFIFNALETKIRGFAHNAFNYTKETVVTEEEKPSLVENATASHLRRLYSKLYYGQSAKREIDFVGFSEGRHSFIEVKYQSKISPNEFSWAKGTMGKQDLWVLTQKDYEENKIKLIPAEIFLGSVGNIRAR
jgi:predicted AAA+ superfamily ATPase